MTCSGAFPLIVVACGLQDPGNLGTLIRSAEAFGASGVLTTPGTVSAWNGKALRASAGSIFRMPVVSISDRRPELSPPGRGVRLLAAVGEGTEGTASIAESHCGRPDHQYRTSHRQRRCRPLRGSARPRRSACNDSLLRHRRKPQRRHRRLDPAVYGADSAQSLVGQAGPATVACMSPCG